jgi:aminoglycoside 2'-N-acetyltransferase I
VTDIAVVRTVDAPADLLAACHRLLLEAFNDGFGADDWEHALGGHHVIATEDGTVVGHAAVVPRTVDVGGRELSAGYVESVATARARRGDGVGSAVMERAAELIREGFDIGALSTGVHDFYERLGWVRWRGPTFVRCGDGLERTPDEDDGLMVLVTGVAVDLTAPIACEERSGDDW